MKTVFIFTYGTLLEGRRNYEKYLRGRVLSTKKAYVLGELYHLENKDYPGFVSCIEGDVQKSNDNIVRKMNDKKVQKVYGEIHEIPDDKELIAALNELESCDNDDDFYNEYIRKELEVYDLDDKLFAKLPVYVYNPDSKLSEGDKRIKVSSGDWNEYKNNN